MVIKFKFEFIFVVNKKKLRGWFFPRLITDDALVSSYHGINCFEENLVCEGLVFKHLEEMSGLGHGSVVPVVALTDKFVEGQKIMLAF
jgi:hypothetical protein